MEELHSAFRAVQLVIFVALALLTLEQWRRRRGAERAWIAATFSCLGAVAIINRIVPPEATGTVADLVSKLSVLLIVALPYCLFRFTATFETPPKWVTRAGEILTGLTAIATIVLPGIPAEDEERTAFFSAYLVLLLAQWTFLLVAVSVRLWRSGKGQPTVTRRRMRTLSMGALSLALALVVSASTSSPDNHPGIRVIVDLLSTASALMFFLGFAPPGFLLAIWRRTEVARLRRAQADLVSAVTPADVANALLPSMTGAVGATAAVLATREGEVVGFYGLNAADAETVAQRASSGSFEPIHAGQNLTTLALQEGFISVLTTQSTPYFGREEVEMLRAIANIADLALSRSRLTASQVQTAQDLQEANDALRNFVAVASHDLRTPIAVIKGYTSALRDDWWEQSDDEKLEFISTIDRQTNHLARLVDDLLTLSKIDAHAMQPVTEEVQLVSVVDDVLKDVAPGSHDVDVAINPDVVVTADKDHTYRMLRNYLENAMKYGAAPIKIDCNRRDELVEVCVADSGQGVPADFAPRLFEKFARATTSSQNGRTGTGLGLSIVKGLAKAGGGNAWYQPNEPRGSRFLVSFRAARPKDAKIAEQPMARSDEE